MINFDGVVDENAFEESNLPLQRDIKRIFITHKAGIGMHSIETSYRLVK